MYEVKFYLIRWVFGILIYNNCVIKCIGISIKFDVIYRGFLVLWLMSYFLF